MSTATTAFEVVAVANGIRWSFGDWFAVVNEERSIEAEECESVDETMEILTRDADCGGVFDCSDVAVLQAGLVDAADDESCDDTKSLNAEFIRNSGVFN